jgi:hypothetical protein
VFKSSIEIQGEPDDSIVGLKLTIKQNGVTAIANWDFNGFNGVEDDFKTPFGPLKKKKLSKEFLFSLLNAEAAKIDVNHNGTVSLQIEATSKNGHKAVYEAGKFTILTRSSWIGDWRRSGRDESRGGDDWGQPATISKLNSLFSSYGLGMANSLNFQVNDISNMNGGSFAPDHTSHRNGKIVDAFIRNYNSDSTVFDAALAEDLLRIMQGIGSDLESICVETSFTQANPFFAVLNSPTAIVGNLPARQYLRNCAGHKDHFHFVLR